MIYGAVAASSLPSHSNASAAELWHMSGSGCNPEQQAGRSGLPKMAQRLSTFNCTQRTPAGLPSGMPGIGLEMDGAVQQAPQLGLQSMAFNNVAIAAKDIAESPINPGTLAPAR